MAVVRFGVSLQEDQLEALDNYVRDSQFANRSQAFRQLISKNLVENKWQHNKIVAGAITLVYNHHKRDLSLKLTKIQHDYYDVILSAQHFHLDHDKCLEIVAVKGKALRLTELSDKLIAIKGIQHGKLVMSTVD
ncbi:MAG: nickel-responsive transcriptional regulator NikR [Bacteroidetes bacterium]|nr:nickel-responsive transcriptional regulator NikR [Bacteroidota bacterium]